MDNRLFGSAAVGLLLVALDGGSAAHAQATAGCTTTAWKLLLACDLDAREGFQVGLANCANLSTPAARRACRLEAEVARGEAIDLCIDQLVARVNVCELLEEDRYDPDPLTDESIAFVDPDEIPSLHSANPYFSLEAGKTAVIRAGQGGEETVVVHVTDRKREIRGVDCRVVVDAVLVAEDDGEGGTEYVGVEVTDDWYAQDDEGNVYYCGELSRNFEDGVLRDVDGSFEAGREQAKAGRLIAGLPVAGAAHRQEFALGEAEDVIQYVDLAAVPGDELGGENPAFPCAPDGCLQTWDFAPLSPDAAEYKFYLPGVGFVLGVALEDGEPTGERDELLCSGDSLDVLQDASCAIEDPAALLGALCKLSPDTFCDAGVAPAAAPARRPSRAR